MPKEFIGADGTVNRGMKTIEQIPQPAKKNHYVKYHMHINRINQFFVERPIQKTQLDSTCSTQAATETPSGCRFIN